MHHDKARILSIETGGDICSVALSHGDELLSLRESNTSRNHARDLALFIEEIFRENDIDGGDLDAVAVSKGPGSYTGLRIGVSVAKGLCYGSNIKLIAIPSLEVLVQSVIEDFEAGILGIDSLKNAVLSPMIDARRMEVYQQLFSHEGNPISELQPHIITPESFEEYRDCEKFLIFGSGAKKCEEVLQIKGLEFVEATQSARAMVELANRRFVNGQFEDVAYFEPLYLKEFVAAPAKKLL
ncbi:MAG: tRNA (adenosine(37)-N6)-threonylcarbamoyltransferase complex dimerization subunit type 1 TsaB [Rikenellaceae bacterium]